MSSVVRVAAILVLALFLGLHWIVLQTVAWTGMLFSFSQQHSLREAVAMTFDGKHPCRMCSVVEEGRSAEQEQRSAVNLQSKLDAFVLASCGVPQLFPPQAEPERRIARPALLRFDPPRLRPPIAA